MAIKEDLLLADYCMQRHELYKPQSPMLYSIDFLPLFFCHLLMNNSVWLFLLQKKGTSCLNGATIHRIKCLREEGEAYVSSHSPTFWVLQLIANRLLAYNDTQGVY